MTKPKSKTAVKTRPPFNEVPSAKVLLSKWMLCDINSTSLPFAQKNQLFLDTLTYILGDGELAKSVSGLEFSKKNLEKLLHQTAG